MSVNEKDLLIIRHHFLYRNSKGKVVKREPKVVLDAFYILEVEYNQTLYQRQAFIKPEKCIESKKLMKAKYNKLLIEDILREINQCEK